MKHLNYSLLSFSEQEWAKLGLYSEGVYVELRCAFQVQNFMFFLKKSVANLGFLELDCISAFQSSWFELRWKILVQNSFTGCSDSSQTWETRNNWNWNSLSKPLFY